MNNAIRAGIRSYLNIQEAQPKGVTIRELLDYEGNAIRNRIWYRGDSYELSQLYEQISSGADSMKFWAAKASPGQEIRKIHTGIPALTVDMLARIALADMNISIEADQAAEELFDEMSKPEENNLAKEISEAVKETLYIGDGAFKITFDTEISEYPIVEYYPGDRIELDVRRGRIREVIFKTEYDKPYEGYVLKEHYGYGYIRNELTYRGNTVDLSAIKEKEIIEPGWEFGSEDDRYMLAVPMRFFESAKWKERGQSIFDKKTDSYDALDEAWSQWMDALRSGRSKTYIPSRLIPRNPADGSLLMPNAFDMRYVQVESDMTEGVENKIVSAEHPIAHDSYIATYTTALDLALQGIISPSTLGIDVKKLDNAEAQREKEKATLYSRNAIIDALQVDIPLLVKTMLKAYAEFYELPAKDYEVTVEFGDYANPSFESQVETISKAKTGGIMSIEAAVDELYGDDKDDEWKAEEVARLKAEQGVAEMEEPAVNMELGGFSVDLEDTDAGTSNESGIQDDKGTVQRSAEGSEGAGAAGSIRS